MKANIVETHIIWKEIVEILSKSFSLEYSGNNPYKLKTENIEIFFYVRNLTRAYTDRSFDVCRIQLHRSLQFKEIITSVAPLVTIGYCDEHKTVCIWNSDSVKPRLNGKGNVSLYCRFSEMLPVNNREKRECKLSNGDVVTILNLSDIDTLILETISKYCKSDKAISDVAKDVTLIDHHFCIREIIQNSEKDISELAKIKLCIEYFEKHSIDYTMNEIKRILSF